MMKQKPNILLICGSTRQGSYTHALMQCIATRFDKAVHQTFFCLRDSILPIANPKYHKNPQRNPAPLVKEFVTLVEKADAFIIGSPIYHNSYSGVLKNALDHLAIKQFKNKPVVLVSHGGHRSTQAVDHLRIVMRGFLAVPIPTHICTAKFDFEYIDGESPLLTDKSIISRVERCKDEMLDFVRLLEPIYKNSQTE